MKTRCETCKEMVGCPTCPHKDDVEYTVPELVEALRDYADQDCYSEEQFKTRRLCWELANRIEKAFTPRKET